ncbi:hypothetical protein GQ53DRAFT_819751 [Thozetella sp. PMI_491]|nr:hypothetical protein GQ53DRAFT_819751 [Thozetella sp. PMI_491]
MHSSHTILGSVSALLSLANAKPNAVKPRGVQTVHLQEAPMVTETRAYTKDVQTSLTAAGTYTLGVDGCGGLQCIGQVVNIGQPGVVWLTAVGVTTTIYPCFTPTSYSQGTTVFVWPGFGGNPNPVTVTATAECIPTDEVASSAPPATSTQATTPEPSPTAGPKLSCDKSGWLIQQSTFYRVNLTTAQIFPVLSSVGDGSLTNAMGFNPTDDYLYAIQSNKIIRINAAGLTTPVGPLSTSWGSNFLPNQGDIDTNGVYWYGSNGVYWASVDLKPGSPNYGKLIDSGKTTRPAGIQNIIDWVYFPDLGNNVGNALYAIAVRTMGGVALLRFDLTSKQWTILQTYPNVRRTTVGFGAMYGTKDGTLYASDNGNGNIFAFNVKTLASPTGPTTGPVSRQNDGARCILADS